MHLDDERIERFVHGELPAPTRDQAARHLESCAECRNRVDQLFQEAEELKRLLRSVDHATPSVTAASLVARAEARASRLRRAAIVVFSLGAAGAAWAAPGSPIPEWVSDLFRSDTEARVHPGEPAAPTDQDAADAAGIDVAPGRNLTVRIPEARRSGSVILTLSDAADLSIRTGPGEAAFTSDEDRVVVDLLTDSLDLSIAVPRHAPAVDVLIGGRLAFRKIGPRVIADGVPDGPERWVISLAPELQER